MDEWIGRSIDRKKDRWLVGYHVRVRVRVRARATATAMATARVRARTS